MKGGRTVKPGKKRIIFYFFIYLFIFFLLKMSESVILVRKVQTKP